MKTCSRCHKRLHLWLFHLDRSRNGHQRTCKKCKAKMRQENAEHINGYMRRYGRTMRKDQERWPTWAWQRARTRARRTGKEFSISVEDLKAAMPKDGLCPVFGKPLKFGGRDMSWNASLDRIDNEKGYVPGNVVVVSMRANSAKRNLSKAELQQLSVFYNSPAMGSKWDKRFILLAQQVALFSKDPSTKVGAVIVDPQRRVVSVGYNGFARGVADDERLANRAVKYEMIVHGEINAIVSARQDLTGCTLYTVPFEPCSRCASIVVQAGIRRVVAPAPLPEQLARWKDSFELARSVFREAGVELVLL